MNQKPIRAEENDELFIFKTVASHVKKVTTQNYNIVIIVSLAFSERLLYI